MGFKDFIKKAEEKIKEANKSENVKKRLTDKIEIEKLKSQLEDIRNKRRDKPNKKQWKIGL